MRKWMLAGLLLLLCSGVASAGLVSIDFLQPEVETACNDTADHVIGITLQEGCAALTLVRNAVYSPNALTFSYDTGAGAGSGNTADLVYSATYVPYLLPSGGIMGTSGYGDVNPLLNIGFLNPVFHVQVHFIFIGVTADMSPAAAGLFGNTTYLEFPGTHIVYTYPDTSTEDRVVGTIDYYGPGIQDVALSLGGPNTNFVIDSVQFENVPEPAAMLLLGGGLLGIAVLRRRKRA